MTPDAGDITSELLAACAEFWQVYHATMMRLHLSAGRTLHDAIQDRNLGTTDSQHVGVLERFWRRRLAHALGVSEVEVGPRVIQFRPHRRKAFDVCWPVKGEPRILISIKSMQNAYRNLTNRIEEAIGDAALLRLYNSNAVFGFFFFILDGRVASGEAEQGISLRKMGPKGMAPYLDLIEEGGDFFDLSEVSRHGKSNAAKQIKRRKDTIQNASLSLLDLLATGPTPQSSIHYDAIALAPVRIRRIRPDGPDSTVWDVNLSQVDERLDHRLFLPRLLDTARLRGFIEGPEQLGIPP